MYKLFIPLLACLFYLSTQAQISEVWRFDDFNDSCLLHETTELYLDGYNRPVIYNSRGANCDDPHLRLTVLDPATGIPIKDTLWETPIYGALLDWHILPSKDILTYGGIASADKWVRRYDPDLNLRWHQNTTGGIYCSYFGTVDSEGSYYWVNGEDSAANQLCKVDSNGVFSCPLTFPSVSYGYGYRHRRFHVVDSTLYIIGLWTRDTTITFRRIEFDGTVSWTHKLPLADVGSFYQTDQSYLFDNELCFSGLYYCDTCEPEMDYQIFHCVDLDLGVTTRSFVDAHLNMLPEDQGRSYYRRSEVQTESGMSFLGYRNDSTHYIQYGPGSSVTRHSWSFGSSFSGGATVLDQQGLVWDMGRPLDYELGLKDSSGALIAALSFSDTLNLSGRTLPGPDSVVYIGGENSGHYTLIKYSARAADNIVPELEEKLSIYPNPTTNSLTFQLLPSGNWAGEIYSFNGALMESFSQIEDNRIEFNLEPGIYILTLFNEEIRSSAKFVVHK